MNDMICHWTIWKKENTPGSSVVSTDARGKETVSSWPSGIPLKIPAPFAERSKDLALAGNQQTQCGRTILDLVSCHYLCIYLWSRTAMAIETKHPLSCWKIQFIVQHHTIIIHPPPSGTTNIYFKFELLLLWLTSVLSRLMPYWQAGRSDTQKTSMSALWSNRRLTKLGTHLHQHT